MLPLKRKRTASSPEALTPPLSIDDPEGGRFLSRAVHVLSTAATALSQVTILYQCDPAAREGLLRAVECIQAVHDAGGKLLICGVGKSGLVGRKMVASMKSLGIACSFLHPSEALHGDLGDIRPVSSIRIRTTVPVYATHSQLTARNHIYMLLLSLYTYIYIYVCMCIWCMVAYVCTRAKILFYCTVCIPIAH